MSSPSHSPDADERALKRDTQRVLQLLLLGPLVLGTALGWLAGGPLLPYAAAGSVVSHGIGVSLFMLATNGRPMRSLRCGLAVLGGVTGATVSWLVSTRGAPAVHALLSSRLDHALITLPLAGLWLLFLHAMGFIVTRVRRDGPSDIPPSDIPPTGAA